MIQSEPALLQTIQQIVQHNCHIADANQAGDYTLCVYLLKMREFYRWEQGQAFSENLENHSVGSWLREREELWDKVAEHDFKPITISKRRYDPFDTDSINQALEPHGLVYSGGYGLRTRPHFFLGKLIQMQIHDEYRVYVSDEEYARDLTAPPAMALGKTIFIRREAIKRMLWEKVETWNWNKPDNALGRAIQHYHFDNDIDDALEQMTESELHNVLLHEIGEVKAGQLLGSAWEDMLADMPHSKAELMLRAVRDHLADALSTLPAIIDDDHPAALHFYIGNLTNMRKHLFPSLLDAYQQWHSTGDKTALYKLIERSRQHWQTAANDALALANKPKAQNLIAEMLESRILA